MHPFQRILLATQHTEFDSGSERLAFEMAARCDMPLSIVVPVVSNPEYEIEAPDLIARSEHEIALKIEELRKRGSDMALAVEVVARRGAEPYREILAEASRLHSELIITRRRGKHGFLANLLVGEMVSSVVKHASCSVLMAPRSAKMWTNGVFAAVDSSPVAEQVASIAAKIAAQCGIPLTLASVAQNHSTNLIDEAGAAVDRCADAARAAGAEVTGQVLIGRPCEQILQAAKSAAADLIVIGRHGAGGAIHNLFGNTAHKVVGMSDEPVLVVHA